MKPVICTASGIEFNAFAPRVEDINIDDIAHALASKSRWGGHSKWDARAKTPYTIAQHSWDVSFRCNRLDAAYGLLHDAAEAYFQDITSPHKPHFYVRNPMTGDFEPFSVAEDRLLGVIFARFGMDSTWWKVNGALHLALPASVKAADAKAADIERAALMPETDWWPMRVPPQTFPIVSAAKAKALFLKRFDQLVEQGLLHR